MENFLDRALEKIDKGEKERMGRYEEAMKSEVGSALRNFCRQDTEFAQAVVQGGSFSDCMKAVAKGVKGSSISDLKAFGLAVEFYFPGAGIEVTMNIDLCASVKEKGNPSVAYGDSSLYTREPLKEKAVVIDLTSFL